MSQEVYSAANTLLAQSETLDQALRLFLDEVRAN